MYWLDGWNVKQVDSYNEMDSTVENEYEYHLVGMENSTCTMPELVFESIARLIMDEELKDALQFGLMQLDPSFSLLQIPYHYIDHLYNLQSAM